MRLTRSCCASILLLASAAGWASPGLQLQDSRLIWNAAPYNSFGDLIRFHERWFCAFREADRHVARPGQPADGKIRILTSPDGQSWSSTALVEEPETDLRDPHLSITPDGRMMIIAGGSKYPNGQFRSRRPRVVFSTDGIHWSRPEAVMEDGQWLWRVTWNGDTAYGISKFPENGEAQQTLVASKDGVHWNVIARLNVPGGDEATIRFLEDNRAVILMRADHDSYIGESAPPYKAWQWTKTGHFVGGPDFLVLPDGRMIGGGRIYQNDDPKLPKTGIGFLTPDAFQPEMILPSNGDSSYPGLVYQDGVLWVVYYSSPESGKTAMYLAHIRIAATSETTPPATKVHR